MVFRWVAVLIVASASVVGWVARARFSGSQKSRSEKTVQSGFKPPVTDEASNGWPCLGGPFHNYVSAEVDVQTEWTDAGPPKLWARNVGRGYSSPVVQGERVIVCYRTDDIEVIECLHAIHGGSMWRYQFPTTFKCRYEYSNGPYSTPIIDSNRVVAVGAQGQVHCLDLETGELIWRRMLHEEYSVPEALFAVGASPLIEGSRLIFNLGAAEEEAGVIAMDIRDGSTLWTALDHLASYATPVAATIHGQRYVFVVTFEGLVALDPADGKIFWTEAFRPRAPDSVNATSPIVVGERVVMVTGPGPGTLCIQVFPDHQHEILWQERRVLDSQFNSLLATEGYLYGYSSRRYGGASFRCVDLNTGELQWKWQSELDRGSAIAAANRFILWGENGHLGSLEVSADEPILCSMTAEPLLEKPCYSAPALQDGLLYLRNEHKIVCFDLRLEPASTAGR